MELQHVNAKIFVDGELTIDPARFIEVFHRWVRERLMDELLIDVADYRHVPEGPGVLLIGHEADYSLDQCDGRYGLRYNRKSPIPGDNAARFGQALRSAVKACRMLEDGFSDEGPLRFSRKEFQFFVNDRAMAPNTPETFATCKPDLEAFLTKTVGHTNFELQHHSDPRRCFGTTIKLSDPLDFALLEGSSLP